MRTDSCRVRTLKLKACDRVDVQRGARLVAEALRLSTFPGEGLPGRLLIRSLELDLASDRTSVEALTRVVSDAFSRAWSDAVLFSLPEATRASAVRVPASIDVWFEVARRAVSPAAFDLSAWFWPLLVDNLPPERHRALDLALDALLEPHEGPPLLSILLRSMVEEGTATRMLERLTPSQGIALLGEARLAFTSSSNTVTDDSPTPVHVNAEHAHDLISNVDWRWRPLLAEFVPRWGAEDARSLWLCFAALWGARPSRAVDPHLEKRVRRLVRAALADSDVLPGKMASTQQASASEDSAWSSERSVGPRGPFRIEDRSKLPEGEGSATAIQGIPLWTECAGIFFVLPILARLEMDRFVRSHPGLADLDLVRFVLARIADRLEVSVDDPVWGLICLPDPDGDVLAFEVPPRWLTDLSDSSGLRIYELKASAERRVAVTKDGLPVALWHGAPPSFVPSPRMDGHALAPLKYPGRNGLDVLLDAWERGVTSWLAKHTELDCRALVRRAGRLVLTRTHLDLIFNLNDADVRVRKAALDLNLGYVPHLGRIVTFHYWANEGLR